MQQQQMALWQSYVHRRQLVRRWMRQRSRIIGMRLLHRGFLAIVRYSKSCDTKQTQVHLGCNIVSLLKIMKFQ